MDMTMHKKKVSKAIDKVVENGCFKCVQTHYTNPDWYVAIVEFFHGLPSL